MLRHACLLLTASLVLACLIGSVSPAPGAASPPAATIRVDLRQEKAPVPESLYGIFMEEISHGFDGGIYAELIRNRSFEEGVLPPGMTLVKKEDGKLKMELTSLPPGVPKEKWPMPWPWMMNCGWDPDRALIGWSLRSEGQAKGEMKLTEAHPMNAASSRSLEVTLAGSGGDRGRVLLINSGYWGINLQSAAPYALTFYLRAGTFEGEVSAELQGRDGKVLARHDFGALKPGGAWSSHTAVLRPDGADPRGQFALVFRGRGTLLVDWVSLFPPTYKDRPNGLRKDLATLLEEYRPAFVRYPGGCYVEGLSWESAPDWRKMVCPPHERPGMWGYWQYRSSDGFGYHEFLQFCEDIGADAMYVAFCGMTVHPENNWPLDKIDPVVQQTLDAIEYAIGPADSKWGAVRAKMGHPKPFPLKYVEIGNEHPPAIYGDYYAKFRQAIKAKYPDMTVIMSMYWSGLNHAAIARAGEDKIDIVDEHAYRPSGWARTNVDYFDKYPRKPWKVYLGEYAHHHAGGDFSAAMDDSVFLMMMERNGDVVKMASYAPLLVNVHKRDWGVNLIEFDSSRSFAHASYYVQKTFNANRPDVNLHVEADVSPKPDPSEPLMAGRFGLGSWHTLNEFKELRIYDEQDKLVFRDDFASLDNWQAPGIGKWEVRDGVLRQTDKGPGPAMLLLKARELTAGRVTLKARRVGGNEGFLMFFNAAGIDRFLFCNYGAAGNKFSAIQDRGQPAGCSFRTGQTTPGAIENDRWYEISLKLARGRAEMFLDGKRVSDATAQRLPAFFAAAGYDRKNREIVVKATSYHSQSLPVTIDLEGAAQIGPAGRHILIQSDDPYAENTLDEPLKIVPREKPLNGCAKRFTVTLPPNSVNVLRVPAAR